MLKVNLMPCLADQLWLRPLNTNRQQKYSQMLPEVHKYLYRHELVLALHSSFESSH